MNYQGKRQEGVLRNIKHDIIRDNTKHILKNDRLSAKNYNYDRQEFNKVKDIDSSASDYYYNKNRFLLAVKKDTKKKNAHLKKVITMRILTPREKKLYKMLEAKEHASCGDDELTYEEEKKLYELRMVGISNPKQIKQQAIYLDLDKIYFYKNAYIELKKPHHVEYDGKRTYSKERQINNAGRIVSIIVSKEESVDYVISIRRKNVNAALVNCASHLCPGGSWEKGEEGYEEAIFYRSSYDLSLNGENISDGFYPLVDESSLYSPKVMVYKYGRNRKYAMKAQTSHGEFISIIAACAIHDPKFKKIKTRKNGKIEIKVNKNLLSKKHAELYKDKIKNVLQTALYWGHNAIVFNSFGCVEKDHPSKHCASLIKEVIFNERDMFYKKFCKIVFCIGIKNMASVPKSSNAESKYAHIYKRELDSYNKEQEVYKTFYQTLHGAEC